MQRPEIHDDVKKAVLAWGNGGTASGCAKALAAARAKLAPQHLGQLVSEVAEVTAECAVDILNGDRSGGPKTQIGAMQLSRQAQGLLYAWVMDLKTTAKALGLSFEQWMRELDATMQRMIARAVVAENAGDSVQRVSGAGTRALPPSADAPTGIASQLAARFGTS